MKINERYHVSAVLCSVGQNNEITNILRTAQEYEEAKDLGETTFVTKFEITNAAGKPLLEMGRMTPYDSVEEALNAFKNIL